MTELRITSVADPFGPPRLLDSALALLRRAAAAGLLPRRSSTIDTLDLELIQGIAREAARAGVGSSAAAALAGKSIPAARLRTLIDQLEGAITESPIPARELEELAKLYGVDGAAALLGTSPASLRRYLSGSRAAPDDVAARAHHIAMISGDLAGSYNEVGRRRWWDRPRSALGGRSPREILGRSWQPDDASARQVAELAAALAGPGAAT